MKICKCYPTKSSCPHLNINKQLDNRQGYGEDCSMITSTKI